MIPVFDEVLLMCPDVITGGPEGVHQLAHQINQLGGNAKIVYYGPVSRMEVKGNVISCRSENSLLPEHYVKYKPKVLKETVLTENTLIVYPEVLTAAAALPAYGFQRAIWWQSVDNAFGHNRQLNDEDYVKKLFNDPTLFHLYQSEYALFYLRQNNALNYFSMPDYTNTEFIVNNPLENRPLRICYPAPRGENLAYLCQIRAGRRNEPERIPIKNMTKERVRDELYQARLYIDFGHHPGKDRGPREAALAGCVVMVNAVGAGGCFGDHPLNAKYKFTEEDIISGSLIKIIDDILENPQPHFDAQYAYRQAILLEREKFDTAVSSFFFRSGHCL